MPDVLDITHPAEDAVVGRTFVAFGTSDRKTRKWIKGQLTRRDGGSTLLVSDGLTIQQPKGRNGFWAILFENVAEGTDIKLTLNAGSTDETVLESTERHIGRIRSSYGINILYPQASPPSIGQDFVSYGTTTATGSSVSGTIYNTLENVEGATILQPTSRGSWAISFTNVPVGTEYTLDVVNTLGDNDSKTPIEVA